VSHQAARGPQHTIAARIGDARVLSDLGRLLRRPAGNLRTSDVTCRRGMSAAAPLQRSFSAPAIGPLGLAEKLFEHQGGGGGGAGTVSAPYRDGSHPKARSTPDPRNAADSQPAEVLVR